MKFKENHYESLKQAAINYLTNNNLTIQEYLLRYEGKSETRKAWDLFWFSKWAAYNPNILALYNDNHIDTAIKQVLKDLIKNK